MDGVCAAAVRACLPQLGHELVSVVEINSETDFVGRSEPFQQLLTAAAKAALSLAPSGAAAGQAIELDIKQVSETQMHNS